MSEETLGQQNRELRAALVQIEELKAENERLKQIIQKLNAEKYLKSDRMSSKLRDALRE